MSIESCGLTALEVAARTERGDVNRVTARTSRSISEIIRANILTRFNALLGTLFVVILIAGPWQDALFGGVLIFNALIGIVQEVRAKRILDRLAFMTQPTARVIRAGQTVTIPAENIVLGDIVELASGDQVLVDGIVLTCQSLDIDESLITGESEPVPKRPGDEILSGSVVLAGTGRCRSTRIGASAYAHHLASEARHFHRASSELHDGIDQILRYVTWAIVPTAALLFATQLASHESLAAVLLLSAAGVVAMVPEGLVLLTSLAMAVGSIRLARKQTLVQDLPAIETLARVDTLCIDKTGTLTEREPQVERVDLLEGNQSDAQRVLAAVVAADPRPNATLRAIGRACAEDVHPNVVEFIPFTSANKWSGVTLDGLGSWILGAPEILLTAMPGHAAVQQRAQEHAQAGHRVLLLARAGAAQLSSQLPCDLVPVAFVLLEERVRADAAEAVQYFREQGVAIKVLSGDHPETVGQIAARIGIAHDAPLDARALPGDADALSELLKRRSVFGRISPQQKQSVVAALQAKGHVVAMIGDGVNDILALKKADVAIAMGSAADATRAVAQLILLDERFASLPTVIAEGRRVIGNVERLATLFLTKTIYAMLLAFIVGVAGATFPFLPRHLTLIGALTIGIPAFFLSLERNSSRPHPGFVKRVLGFAVPAGMFVAGATFAVYVLVRGYLGVSEEGARTAAATTLFAVALWVLVLVARPIMPGRRLLVSCMVGLYLVVLSEPELRALFALSLLPWRAWLAIIGITAIVVSVLHWSAAVAAHQPSVAIKSRPLTIKGVLAWVLSADSPKRFVLAAAVLVVGSAWLFFGVLEDVLTHDPLVDVDANVYRLLQSGRTSGIDSMMVAITELGDVHVLLPVIGGTLAWFVGHRLWISAGYWLAAVGVAELLTKVLKLVLRRPSPGMSYLGIEEFSFSSGHATMSVVVYGFLAFLLSRGLMAQSRKHIAVIAAIAITLIAFSRLYLGVHWLSDVLGGMAFGSAWIALLAIAYVYQSTEDIRPRQLTLFLAALILVAGSVHIGFHHAGDVSRYTGIATSSR
jgi:cation-transporting ATPase E/undecaprenyl-diphosphatase